MDVIGASIDDRATRDVPTPREVEMVVDLLESVYQANGRMAEELDRLAASRAAVSDAAVQALTRLAEDLRPGAAARAQLAELGSHLQIAGAAEWIARHRRLDPNAELLPTVRGRASWRAAQRWGHRPGPSGGAA